MNELEKMQELLNAAKEDYAKFEAGNNAAGTRVRKACMEIKNLAQDVRKGVQEKKNTAK
jgi:hypothetical protein